MNNSTEFNEVNNVFRKNLNVRTALPELELSLSNASSIAEVGAAIDLEIAVSNTGYEAAGTSTLEFALSTNHQSY